MYTLQLLSANYYINSEYFEHFTSTVNKKLK